MERDEGDGERLAPTAAGWPGGHDTIVAIATAPGVGALAIVRVSGPDSLRLLVGLVGSADRVPPLRQAGLRRLTSADGELLDEAIVIRLDAAHSYTAEDGFEITCHGGWVTSARIVAALVRAGARPAAPGEYTRRAVLNGRLDLLQAEAVNDLIRAESSAGARVALAQMDGGLSRRIEALRAQLLELEALLAYEIDFPEEDDGPVSDSRILDAADELLDSLNTLVASAPVGELVRHGAVVAIVGPPNVGKSSLFNALLGRQRALVADQPGTTRDALEAVLDVLPVPLRLVDTAGLRETTDAVEQMGVAVSREVLQAASVVLACGDSPQTLSVAEAEGRALAQGEVILVRTKADLNAEEWSATEVPRPAVTVSARSGVGLDNLVQYVSEVVGRAKGLPGPDMPLVVQARHRDVIMRARDEVEAFRRQRAARELPVIVTGVHLREAVRLLEELVGAVDVEEILGRVFSAFCVGK